MPTKTNNSTQNSKDTPYQKLTPLEKDLSECARNHKFVLLYGKDTIGRKELVYKVHKMAIELNAQETAQAIEDGKEMPEKSSPMGSLLIRSFINRNYVDCGAMNIEGICEEINKGITNTLISPYDNPEPQIYDSYPKDYRLFLDSDYLMCVRFFDNLACQHEDFAGYSKLAKIIKEHKKSNSEPLPDGTRRSKYVWLVVYTYNFDSLPLYFREQFREISLEKQVTQDTHVITFPITSGAKVSDIEMVIIDEQTVRITFQDQSKLFNFAQMGFLDRKTGNPNKLWVELALYEGGNGITDQKISERINDTLQAFFVTKQKLLNRKETFFKIRKQTTSRNKTPRQGKSRDCTSCNKKHKNYCSVCKEETEKCQVCHDKEYESFHMKS